MIKIVVNPEFEYLRQYVEGIPGNFDSMGIISDARRNILREDNPEGTRLIIKSFKRIYLTNRIRYSFFYPSKARRAYEYALMLLQKGFNTPRPIAYIEVRQKGLINHSFFICEYSDFVPLNQLSEVLSGERTDLMLDLAHFTYRLHQSNIYHVDYSLGNILFKKINGKSEFALIDNNRMKLGPVSYRLGIRNLNRLGLSEAQFRQLIMEYARLMGGDAEAGLRQLFRTKWFKARLQTFKSSLKRITGKGK